VTRSVVWQAGGQPSEVANKYGYIMVAGPRCPRRLGVLWPTLFVLTCIGGMI
jgi:hypothetical protein